LKTVRSGFHSPKTERPQGPWGVGNPVPGGAPRGGFLRGGKKGLPWGGGAPEKNQKKNKTHGRESRGGERGGGGRGGGANFLLVVRGGEGGKIPGGGRTRPACRAGFLDGPGTTKGALWGGGAGGFFAGGPEGRAGRGLSPSSGTEAWIQTWGKQGGGPRPRPRARGRGRGGAGPGVLYLVRRLWAHPRGGRKGIKQKTFPPGWFGVGT